MANIGSFTADKDGYTGTLRTLTLNVKVKLVPNDKGTTRRPRTFACRPPATISARRGRKPARPGGSTSP